MRLVSFDYSEFKGEDEEWRIEGLRLNQINLIVGKNASGKSRTIRTITSLGRLVCGHQNQLFRSGHYVAQFVDGDSQSRYELKLERGLVTREDFIVDGQDKLRRGSGGYGRVFAREPIEGQPGGMMKFQTPDDQLAVVSRRDAEQHPFLQALYDWGNSTRTFDFGKTMGHTSLIMLVKGPGAVLDDRDTDQVVAILKDGVEKFGDEFTNAIKQDMGAIGYDIEDVSLKRPSNVVNALPGDVLGVAVKEKELKCFTDHTTMSQGMFRSLSMIIQLNYAQLAKRADCIIVDDIGEGLDFERSCALIELLRKKALDSSVQLIMSTNDRFVMNKVPLEEWSFLQRTGSVVTVRNYENSKDIFEQFKLTGLNNFDLLTTDFFSESEEHGKDGDLCGGTDGARIHQETGFEHCESEPSTCR